MERLINPLIIAQASYYKGVSILQKRNLFYLTLYDSPKGLKLCWSSRILISIMLKSLFNAYIRIDNILETFEIERSLSRKGNPYDNAVSEATNKILKIEFIYQNNFDTLEELELQLAEYIYWYNYIRIHGSLGYITPIEYRNKIGLEMVA